MLDYHQEVRAIKNITVRMDDELHKKFKIYSVNTGKDMQAILIEYIKKLVQDDKK